MNPDDYDGTENAFPTPTFTNHVLHPARAVAAEKVVRAVAAVDPWVHARNEDECVFCGVLPNKEHHADCLWRWSVELAKEWDQ